MNNNTDESLKNTNQEDMINQPEEIKEQVDETIKPAEDLESKQECDQKAELEAKLAEMNDKYLRISAEFDNFRKRTLRERADLIKTAGEDFLVSLLPVIDDFDRAMLSIETAEDIQAVKTGIALIYNKLNDFIKSRGIKEIEAKGMDFNTDFHEAVTQIPSPAPEMKGKVIDVVQKGYLLHDKVIRHSKVVVGE